MTMTSTTLMMKTWYHSYRCSLPQVQQVDAAAPDEQTSRTSARIIIS
jgi:hypothetical protein